MNIPDLPGSKQRLPSHGNARAQWIFHHVASRATAPKSACAPRRQPLQQEPSAGNRLRTPPRRRVVDENRPRLDPRQAPAHAHRMGERHLASRGHQPAQPPWHSTSGDAARVGPRHPPVAYGKNNLCNHKQLSLWQRSGNTAIQKAPRESIRCHLGTAQAQR